MDTEEAEVCDFLKTWPGQFVSAREVCRRAGGKWRYREDERWALPVLQRLLEKRQVEADARGHYRLVTEKKPEKKGLILPTKQKRVLQSGDDYGEIDLDQKLGPDDRPEGGSTDVPPTSLV